MRRNKTDIYYELLELIILNPKIKRTLLMQKTNTNYKTIGNYLKILNGNGYIRGIFKDFIITKIGLQYYVDLKIFDYLNHRGYKNE